MFCQKDCLLFQEDLRNIDKELVLLKRDIADLSPEAPRIAMYEKHRKLQVLYIGFLKVKYDLFSHRKDVADIGQRFSEDSYNTVLFILGDPEKSNIPRKLIHHLSGILPLIIFISYWAGLTNLAFFNLRLRD